MTGLITSKDVLRHAPLIIAAFGLGVFVRSVWAVARRERTTFLAIVWGTR